MCFLEVVPVLRPEERTLSLQRYIFGPYGGLKKTFALLKDGGIEVESPVFCFSQDGPIRGESTRQAYFWQTGEVWGWREKMLVNFDSH